MTIAAFDFDGTITTQDTMFSFIRFVKGNIRFFVGIIWLSPNLILHKLGFISAQRAKEKLLSFFFQNETETQLYAWGKVFCEQELPDLLRAKALTCIQVHQKQGHQCYLVTASLPFWTKEWAEKQGFILLATQAEIVAGKFTGKIAGQNCNGEEKVRRLEEVLIEKKNQKKYAYGDTSGDKAMLAWADEAFFKPFR